jgi:hypothetical protein
MSRARAFGVGWLLGMAAGCGQADRASGTPDAAARADAAAADGGAEPASWTLTSAQSWDLCTLSGREAGPAGVYGTDLGFTFEEPGTGPLGTGRGRRGAAWRRTW